VHTPQAISNARKVFTRCELWVGAPIAAIERLFDDSTVEFHNTGSIALAEDEVSRFIVVVSGRVRAVRHDARGHEFTYAHAATGEQLGAVAAMHDQMPGSCFVATEPSVVVKVPADSLRALMREEVAVAYHMALQFSQRFLDLLESLSLQHADVHSRLAAHLLAAARTCDPAHCEPFTFDLGMSRRELAGTLGTVPETLSRAFARLRDFGLISTEGRRLVTILDFDGLEKQAP
jgi:CRP/FNR family transcriptional regulator, dissimilatory nitrate respiration regulator